MIEKIEKIVRENPNKIAYKVNNKMITYHELWEKAKKVAMLLRKEGTSPVILYGNKEIEVLISMIACIIGKRAYLPIGLCTPIERIKNIMEITKSTCILAKERIVVNNISSHTLDELNIYENNSINETNNDIIYIIFTSGSTGSPKGVPISNDNLENFVDWISNLYPLKEYRYCSVLNQAHFSFDLSVADIYYSLCNGHTLVAYDDNCKNDFNHLYEIFQKEQIQVAIMTPTFMKLFLLNDEFNEKKNPFFKCVYFCGETLEKKTVERIWKQFPNLIIINAYGPTETTSAISAIRIKKEMLTNDLLPVGDIHHLATEVEIIDNEIVLKGKSVSRGYLGDGVGGFFQENKKNCYHTGDIGYIEDNLLYCKGRKDNQIKYKGYRIELEDIEKNMNKIPEIKTTCVIAKYDDKNNVKTIKAFVEIENSKIDSSIIKDKLKDYLPEYMIPKTITILDQLPMNQNNKIDRKALMKL